MPNAGPGRSPDNWNDDINPHGQRDGQVDKTYSDDPIKNPKTRFPSSLVDDMHQNADTDTSTFAIHHTLGAKANQASPGNHRHDGGGSINLGQWVDISTKSGLWVASGAGTNPVLGSGGVQTARYCKIGTFCWYKYTFVAGTGTTFGTTSWNFLLPFTAVLPSSGASSLCCGSASGIQIGTNRYAGSVEIADSTHVEIISHTIGSPWGPTVPVTWAANANNRFSLFVGFETTT